MIKKILSWLLDWYMPIILASLMIYTFYEPTGILLVFIALIGIVSSISLVFFEKSRDLYSNLLDEAMSLTEDMLVMLMTYESDLEEYIDENTDLKCKIIALETKLKLKLKGSN